MNDIETREDIVRLVDQFYDKVMKSPLIAHHFGHLDWVAHKPVMYSFWSSMLLGEQSYKRNPFEKHIAIGPGEADFTEWQKLFMQTLDELYAGPRTEELKQRVRSIASVWQLKLSKM
jgi:hemoglobin